MHLSEIKTDASALGSPGEVGSMDTDELFPSLEGADLGGFSSTDSLLGRGQVCGVCQPKPPCLFFPRQLNCSRPVRAPGLASRASQEFAVGPVVRT